jgi:small-conductance mechanosensitive channel
MEIFEHTFFIQLEKFFNSTPGGILSAIFIIFITYLINKVQRRFFDRKIEKLDFVKRHDPTTYAFIKHGISGIVFLIGITFAIFKIPALKDLSVSLFASAGVLALIVGFASQQAFANIVSGIFITIFKPFRVGDRIAIKGTVEGIIEDITLRHVNIKTLENKRVIIPNNLISNKVIENFHIEDEKICKLLYYNISFDSDINKAISIIQEEVLAHPDFLDNRTKAERDEDIHPVTVRVVEWSDYSICLRAQVWTMDPDSAYVIGWDLNKSIKEKFDKMGIEIPFPYRTVVYKKDLKK